MNRFILKSALTIPLLWSSTVSAADGLSTSSLAANRNLRLAAPQWQLTTAAEQPTTVLIQRFGPPDAQVSELMAAAKNRLLDPSTTGPRSPEPSTLIHPLLRLDQTAWGGASDLNPAHTVAFASLRGPTILAPGKFGPSQDLRRDLDSAATSTNAFSLHFR